MNKIIQKVFFLFFFLILTGWSFSAQANLPVTDSLAPMLRNIMPSIVNLRAELKITDLNTLNRLQKEQQLRDNNDNLPIPNKVVSVGSGVIVNAEKGYILTNAHVVKDAEIIKVTLSDGYQYTAKIIGSDLPSDIALLQIHAKNLKAIHIGNSSILQVGDFVAAIGNPFGLNQSVTSGIVSALGRSTLGIEAFENFIQTDAPINPGNSGGALINSKGELIGINTAIVAPDRGSVGIGLAIPSNLVKSVMQQLIQYGNVKRGILGVGVQDITPELQDAMGLSTTQGAVTTLVMPNSPAEKAGFKTGDIVMNIDGTKILKANDVVNAVGFLRVNSQATISILRQGKTMELTAKLEDPQQREQENQKEHPFFYGVTMKNFSVTSPVHGNLHGILVIAVQEDTNAWRSDLRPGDIITMANQQLVLSVNDLEKVSAAVTGNLLLNIHRGNGAIFLVINKGT